MRQQINLYQPIFRQERRFFSANMVGFAFATIAVALVSIWLYGSAKVAQLQIEVAHMRAQFEEQQHVVDAAGRLRSGRANPTEIQERVAALSRELADRTEALRLLRSGVAGQTTGFSERLTALARQHVDGLWIDRLMFAGTSGSMSIEGRTVSAPLVPQYLKRLASESALQGTRFEQFHIERPAEAERAAGGLRFEASSSKELSATESKS
jgi:uncharacterized small protein (DUF1192 family)